MESAKHTEGKPVDLSLFDLLSIYKRAGCQLSIDEARNEAYNVAGVTDSISGREAMDDAFHDKYTWAKTEGYITDEKRSQLTGKGIGWLGDRA